MVQDLPCNLRETCYVNFDGSWLAQALVDMLRKPVVQQEIGKFALMEADDPSVMLCSFKFNEGCDVFGQFKDQMKLKRIVSSDAEFLAIYETFVKTVVCPYLKRERLNEQGAMEFHYQFPPTVRIQPGPSDQYRPTHTDDKYGHQDGEINFWVPLSSYKLCQTTIWVEKDQDSFEPAEIDHGTMLCFHGTSLKHHVPANKTEFTRISIDFRIGIGNCFDKDYKLKGLPYSHPRKSFTL